VAYPFSILSFEPAVNDTVGGLPVLVVFQDRTSTGVVFDRTLDGQVLTFQVLDEDLMTLVDTKVKRDTGAPLPKSRGKRRSFLSRTAQLFEKHQGCYACHRYLNKRGQELGGFSGPSLVEAGKRLQADWVFAFLKDPRRYYPNGKCPVPGDKAFNKYTDENRAAVATYIVNIGTR
jgi:hypothetical protein